MVISKLSIWSEFAISSVILLCVIKKSILNVWGFFLSKWLLHSLLFVGLPVTSWLESSLALCMLGLQHPSSWLLFSVSLCSNLQINVLPYVENTDIMRNNIFYLTAVLYVLPLKRKWTLFNSSFAFHFLMIDNLFMKRWNTGKRRETLICSFCTVLILNMHSHMADAWIL